MLRASLSFSAALAGLIKGTISPSKPFLTVIKICVCLLWKVEVVLDTLLGK